MVASELKSDEHKWIYVAHKFPQMLLGPLDVWCGMQKTVENEHTPKIFHQIQMIASMDSNKFVEED